MDHRPLGRTGLMLSPIGFGAFKIGRNQRIKYQEPYALPSEAQAVELIRGLLSLGVNYIDTAPAYGLSEQRVGLALGSTTLPCVVSTKVGESFSDGESSFDFSRTGVNESLSRSRGLLRRPVLDLVFIHSDGDDLRILHHADVVSALTEAKRQGDVRFVGFSGKTVEGAAEALAWADAIMVEHHLEDRRHEAVIAEAAARGVGVIVKKGLGSGRLDPAESIRFVLENPHITSLVIGGLNLDHFRENIAAADRVTAQRVSSAGNRSARAEG